MTTMRVGLYSPVKRGQDMKQEIGKISVYGGMFGSDWADVTSAGRSFQMCTRATGKARLPTLEQRTGMVAREGSEFRHIVLDE